MLDRLLDHLEKVYFVLALAAWLLIAGWLYADRCSPSSSWGGVPSPGRARKYSGVSVLVAAPLALIWPVGIPIAALITSYVKAGWQAPWDFTSQLEGMRYR